MKRMTRVALLALAVVMSIGLVGCDFLMEGLDDWLSAPYGYVYDNEGAPIEGASVTVYKTSVSDTNKVQDTVTTSSTGYFTLSSKVDSTGGTYIVVVSKSGYTFENLTVPVPTDQYLFAIGTILPYEEVEVEVEVEVLYSAVNGVVINAKAASTETEYWKSGTESLEGAEIGIYAYDETTGLFATTTSYTGTVSATGTYEVADVNVGKYYITGEKTGWTFVPRIVEIAGTDVQLPQLMAFPDEDAYTVTVLVSWEDEAIDLDSYMTYWDGTARDKVYFGTNDATYDDGYGVNGTTYIKLDRDVTTSTASTIPRVETMTISAPDSFAEVPYFGVAPNDATGTTDGINDNQLRYYVHCWNADATQTLTGVDGDKKSAFAQVDVMYMDGDGASWHMGSWELPWNTDETTLHVVNIDAESDGSFTIYSAGNVDGTANIKSFSTGPVEVNAIR